MKILFLCGCFEPGRDGVGDYCRLLSGALLKLGHSIEVIAFNDNYLRKEVKVEIQRKEGADIKVLRIGYKQTSSEKIRNAKIRVKNFNPDIISLQYVPYSFQKNGLPITLISDLKAIGMNYSWHIMFHELWVGVSKFSSLKHKFIGFFQRKIAQKIVKTLNPSLITTSNLMYQTILSEFKIQSKILPLFSNIPKSSLDLVYKKKILEKLDIKEDHRKRNILAGTFGTIHREASLEERLLELEEVANSQSKKLVFINFGRIGHFGKVELVRLKSKFKNRIKFLTLGEISLKKISTLLQMLDYGISCTPFEYLPKSGVYAAMKFHGVKVISTNTVKLPEYKAEIQKSHQNYSKKDSGEWNVEFIAGKYLFLLNYKNYDFNPTSTSTTSIEN